MRMGATHWSCTGCTEIVHADEATVIADGVHEGVYHAECAPPPAVTGVEV
jgi:hypothetical protein